VSSADKDWKHSRFEFSRWLTISLLAIGEKQRWSREFKKNIPARNLLPIAYAFQFITLFLFKTVSVTIENQWLVEWNLSLHDQASKRYRTTSFSLSFKQCLSYALTGLNGNKICKHCRNHLTPCRSGLTQRKRNHIKQLFLRELCVSFGSKEILISLI